MAELRVERVITAFEQAKNKHNHPITRTAVEMKLVSAPVGGLLYSLLHLGGFPNDLAFYSGRCGGGRVLELGCGDGRLGVHLCLGESPLTVLQQNMEGAPSPPPQQNSAAAAAAPEAYVGVELCAPLAAKARERLAAAPSATVVTADFLDPLPAGEATFDAALVSANTLFATPSHAALLSQCSAALKPGGVLLLDVYNALPWHPEEGEWQQIGGEDEDDTGAGLEAEAEEEAEDEDDEPTLLVRVQDEDGRDWRVYESEPEVEAEQQKITCTYDFKEATATSTAGAGDSGGETFSESLVHHYLLPEQLVRLLDTHGFSIDEIFGDFDEAPFEPEESEHLVVVARRRAADL